MSAGLPNIIGKTDKIWKLDSGNVETGAIKTDATGKVKGAGGTNNSYNLTFDAHRSSTIYGNSSTVTPLSLSTKLILKY